MAQSEKPSWAKGLKRRGLYYEGLVDSGDLESILEGHKRSTITSYGTRTSSNLTTNPGKTLTSSKIDAAHSAAHKGKVL